MMIASWDWRVNTEKEVRSAAFAVGSFSASIFSTLGPTLFPFKKLRKTKVNQEGIIGVFIDFLIPVSIAVEKPP